MSVIAVARPSGRSFPPDCSIPPPQLKPDNVLLDVTGHLKLGDMGAARGIAFDGFVAGHNRESISAAKTARVREGASDGRQRRMTITGTHGYRAPEVYEREYGFAADWWNVGILVVEMLTMENPVHAHHVSPFCHVHKIPPRLHLPEKARLVPVTFGYALLTCPASPQRRPHEPPTARARSFEATTARSRNT